MDIFIGVGGQGSKLEIFYDHKDKFCLQIYAFFLFKFN